MSVIHRIGDLEISQDIKHLQRSWAAQRIGWVVLLLILVGAVLGLFGPGVFNLGVVESQDGSLRAEYRRFWRMQSPMTLTLHLGSRAGSDGEARVWMDRSYLQSVHVQHVTPQPQRVEAGPDRLTYVFALSDRENSVAVTFDLLPESPGLASGAAGLESGSEIRFEQIIYP